MGERVVVVGGGNSAMDAARTAYRLGAQEVTILAIEDQDSLPAHPEEVRQAREEGVRFMLGAAPVELLGQGRIAAVKAQPAHWEVSEGSPPRIVYDSDSPFTLEADTLIVAIGQRPHLRQDGLDKGLELGRGGRLGVDENGRTGLEGIFAAGDVVTGPSTVVGSMAQGRRVAGQVYAYLTGRPSPVEVLGPGDHGVGQHLAIGEDLPQWPRQEMGQRQPKARCRDFEEVEFGFSDEQAHAEARRCLSCASCCECLACEAACQEVGAIGHQRGPRRLELDCPALIVADGAELPPGLAQEGARIYRLDRAGYSPDLMDVLMAGSAAAGQAMDAAIHLRARPRPSPSEPAPEPIPAGAEARVGFFLCACNQTLAPPQVLEGLIELAASVPGTLHSQTVFSCCHPQGAATIAQAVRAQGLNRVILASCVCCPLNFHCISCNDQRSRAKQHLFENLGLVRCAFETINLRDHLAAGNPSPEQMLSRGRELLRGAFIRARYLGPLTQGLTDMGRRVLVLGGSEVGLSCALNLAHQGLKVRLVDQASLEGQELPPEIARRPEPAGLPPALSLVPRAEVLGIQGSIGDFAVTARVGGHKRLWNCRRGLPHRPQSFGTGALCRPGRAQEVLPLRLRLFPHPPGGALPGDAAHPAAGQGLRGRGGAGRRGGRRRGPGLPERPPAQPPGGPRALPGLRPLPGHLPLRGRAPGAGRGRPLHLPGAAPQLRGLRRLRGALPGDGHGYSLLQQPASGKAGG